MREAQDNRRLRVVLMSNRWWTGGAEAMLAKLVYGLRARGHAVRCCFLYDQSDGGSLPPSGTTFLLSGRFRPWHLVTVIRSLLAFLTRPKPDVIITFHPKASVLAHLVATVVGIRGRIASQRTVASAERRAIRGLDGLFGSLGCYRRIAMVSRSALDTFAAWPAAYRRRCRVLPNGVMPPHVIASPDRSVPGRPHVVAVGRLDPVKNHLLLLDAIAQHGQAHLSIAGDGPMRAALLERAQALGVSARFHLLGTLPPAAVWALVADADIYAMPSHFEGMSNALLEALASGAVILASDIPAQREVLRDAAGVAAGMLLPFDATAWAKAIAEVAAEDGQCASMLRQRARARAREFTMERCIDRYENLFHAVSGRRQRARREPGHRLRLLGWPCDLLHARSLHAWLHRAVLSGRSTLIANHNVNSMVRVADSPGMQQCYETADLTLVDGMPLIWWARALGHPARSRHRLCWLDHLDTVFAQAVQRRWRITHIGGRPGVGERAKQTILARHPHVDLTVHHGHFTDDGPEAALLMAELHQRRPHLLLIGMGMPKQEEWVVAHRHRLPPCVVMTCGGTFDVYAGVTPRAPRWLGPLGLEWIFRLFSEPGRLWRRYLRDPWRLVPRLLKDLQRPRGSLRSGTVPDVQSLSRPTRSPRSERTAPGSDPRNSTRAEAPGFKESSGTSG